MHSCIRGINAESFMISRSMPSQPKPCQAPSPSYAKLFSPSHAKLPSPSHAKPPSRSHAKPCHFPPSSRPPLPLDPQTSISESKIEREGERALLIKGIVIIIMYAGDIPHRNQDNQRRKEEHQSQCLLNNHDRNNHDLNPEYNNHDLTS